MLGVCKSELQQVGQDMDAWHRATSFSEAVNCLATDANGASAPCLSSFVHLARSQSQEIAKKVELSLN